MGCAYKMSIQTAKSASSARLYLIAAVLMFVQTGVVLLVRGFIPNTGDYNYWLMMDNIAIMQWVFPLIGGLFIIGHFFAKTGIGVTGTTERYVGGGYYQRTVETANGITCGCMTGLAVIMVSIGISLPLMEWTGGLLMVGLIPAILAGLVAMIAGYKSLSATVKQGTAEMKQTPSVVRADSRTCPYCNKTGISPHATICPSCGQPLE